MVGCCEHGNKIYGSIQSGEFLHYLSVQSASKKHSAPWGWSGFKCSTGQISLKHFIAYKISYSRTNGINVL
jgi:hypothetical protein